MTTQQRRRRDSYQAILDHFDAHPAVWSAKPPAVRAVGEWRTLLTRVAVFETVQARNTTGKTRTREEQVEHVVEIAGDLIGKLETYARLNDDPDLLAVVDLSPTDLRTLPDTERAARLADVTDAARARLGALAPDYEVTAEAVDAVDAEAALAVARAAARDDAEDDRTVATRRLGELFPAFPPLREALDEIVDHLLGDDAFRDGYYQARKVDG